MNMCPICNKNPAEISFPAINRGGRPSISCHKCYSDFLKVGVGKILRGQSGTENPRKKIVNHFSFTFEGANPTGVDWMRKHGFSASSTRKHSEVMPNLKGTINSTDFLANSLIPQGIIEVGNSPRFTIEFYALDEHETYKYSGDPSGWSDFVRKSEDEFVKLINDKYNMGWRSALKMGTRK